MFGPFLNMFALIRTWVKSAGRPSRHDASFRDNLGVPLPPPPAKDAQLRFQLIPGK